MPSPEYIAELRKAILAVHDAVATHVSTAKVVELFGGQVAFDGDVEIFTITGHSKAKRCYAWAWFDKGTWRSTCVLEIPPVDSAGTAVTIALAAKAKQHVEKN